MSIILSTLFYIPPFLLLSIPILHTVSNFLSLPRLSFIARCIGTFIAFTLSAAFGVVSGIILKLTGYSGLTQYCVSRSFKYTMRILTGITCSISDPNSSLAIRPAVFVGNHQTELDVLVLGCVFPPYCSVTSKASLKYWPLLGQFMLLSKTVFINRSKSIQARAAFAGAVETIKRDSQSVWIFPEGTRSYTKQADMLAFKKGAFHLAVQAQVDIVPVVVANYSNVLDAKSWVFNAGAIPVSVMKRVETKGLGPDDVAALTERVRKMMQEELVRVTEQAQRDGIAVPGKHAGSVEEAINEDTKKGI